MRTYLLTLPPSSNTAYPTNQRGGGRHLSRAGREWKRINAGIFLPAPYPPIQAFTVHIRLWFPDNRRRDVGNYHKLIVDALCEAWGVDDQWQVIPKLSVEAMGIARAEPRAELFVRLVDEPEPEEASGAPPSLEEEARRTRRDFL